MRIFKISLACGFLGKSTLAKIRKVDKKIAKILQYIIFRSVLFLKIFEIYLYLLSDFSKIEKKCTDNELNHKKTL